MRCSLEGPLQGSVAGHLGRETGALACGLPGDGDRQGVHGSHPHKSGTFRRWVMAVVAASKPLVGQGGYLRCLFFGYPGQGVATEAK